MPLIQLADTDLCQPVKATTTISQPVKRVAWDNLRWDVVAAVVCTVLVMISWSAYDHRAASHGDATSLHRSNAAEQQLPAKLSSASNPTLNPQTAPGRTEGMKAAGSVFKLVRVGQNEVDYVAEDVTIRHFTPKPRHHPQIRAGEKPGRFRRRCDSTLFRVQTTGYIADTASVWRRPICGTLAFVLLPDRISVKSCRVFIRVYRAFSHTISQRATEGSFFSMSLRIMRPPSKR